MENQKIQQLIRLASIADNNGDYKIADKLFEKLAAAPPRVPRYRNFEEFMTWVRKAAGNLDNLNKWLPTDSLRLEGVKKILINSKSQSLVNFAALHNFLIILLVYYYFFSEFVGDGIFLTRLKTGSNLFGFHIQGLAVLTLVGLIVASIKKIFFYKDTLNSINLFSIAALFGAAVFYGLVGHDEFMRHQVQNIPFYILLFINIFRRKVNHA